MKMLLLLAGLLVQGIAFAQTTAVKHGDLKYSYAELRFTDLDANGGDGLVLGGSYDLDNNWLIVGSFSALEFNNNVDVDILELGAGYVWNYNENFDLLSTLRIVRTEVDVAGTSTDDSGFAFSAGLRGFVAPDFEVRGSVNHINLDNNDTFLELAGDYHFTEQFAAGISLEFAGDTDAFTIGARWYF